MRKKIDPAAAGRLAALAREARDQSPELERGFQREADWRKAEALRNVAVLVAARKAMGSGR